VNKYRFKISPRDLGTNIPIQIDFQNFGKEDLISEYEDYVVEKVINPVEDFEVTRFSHKSWVKENIENTSIQYDFFFFDRLLPIENTSPQNINNWVSDYNYSNNEQYSGITFTNEQVYYFVNSFRNSFFKLDFYDSNDNETQKIYLTITLPLQQGKTKDVGLNIASVLGDVEVNTPSFVLDYIGNKEGYFIYWLKNPTYIDINEFYVSAKFFNGKTGEFTRFMTTPQCQFTPKFKINRKKYFYNRVSLNYETFEYEVFDEVSGERIGTEDNPIKWYEYINPS